MCNLDEVVDRFAGRSEWFDKHYATPRGRVRLELVLERLRHRLPPVPARILDAGGGTGAFAIPLAKIGYDVTLLDASDEWLERAERNAASAGVSLPLVNAPMEELPLDQAPFDAILCHTVLLYVEQPEAVLRALHSAARPAAILSLLEKNRDALALRPGLAGDYGEAHRLLDARDSVGRLSVENRAHSLDEWSNMLLRTGWEVIEWAGCRLFSDVAPDVLDADAYVALLDLERAAGTREPYRSISRLVHLIARRSQ
jgi:S-adenosylmethionine-dependent methyltransferase